MQLNCFWRDVPADYGPPTTIYNRYNRWAQRRISHSLGRVSSAIERSLAGWSVAPGEACNQILHLTIQERVARNEGAGLTDPVAITAQAVPVPQDTGPVNYTAWPRPAARPSPRREPSPVDAFLKEIEPFFHDHPITYVDVGAHRGDVLQAIVEKGPRLREALLVEPNPTSFSALEERVGTLDVTEKARCFNVALSDAPGRLRLRYDDDMTKVIDPAGEAVAPGRVFEIEAVTLDTLASQLSKPRINLLKIDVEGHELAVLAGAKGLLVEQSVEMIYIEAGLNPESTQQTYYRLIEDALAAYGYRVFRIFEQTHEWREDSPFLRRINLAFMSPRFAAAHPYRLCKKLLTARRANEALKLESAASAANLAALRKDHGALRAKHDVVSERLHRLGAENEELRRSLAVAEGDATALRRDNAVVSENLRQRLAEVAHATELLDEQRRIGSALTTRLSEQLAEAERRGAEVAAELAKERAHAAGFKAGFDKLERYALDLEMKYAAVLESETWRAMAPVRSVMRALKGRKLPTPFVPKLGAIRAGAYSQKPARAVTAAGAEEVGELRRYEHHLWGGLSRPAVRELERVLADPAYSPRNRYDAAHKLATWYAFEGDLDAALRVIGAIDEVAPPHAGGRERLIKEGFIHLRRGDKQAARAAFERLLQEKSKLRHADATLALANCLSDDDGRLAQINKVFLRAGHAGITRIDAARPLTIDNIRGVQAKCMIPQEYKISVIMPTFAAENTIRMAIRSLQEQTYSNLEIIVVDDCSPDRTYAVAAELAKSDGRIVAIRQERNGGPYAARNLGLAHATGAFITTHDSDDWSHPQKIERQLAYLLRKPSVMGVCSYWIRTTSDLQITPNWRIGDRVIHWSHSSFLFRRKVVERLGSWDPVRVGADTEFIWRVEAAYGKDAFQRIEKSVPLAFALDDEGSLTRTKQTHVRTIHYGLRQIYRAVAQHSHNRPGGVDPAFARHRLDALPAVLKNVAHDRLELDHLMIGDCTNPLVVSQMEACVSDLDFEGKRVGVFHWPDFNADPALICAGYADLLLDRKVISVPPQTEISLKSGLGTFFGDCTVEPDMLPVVLHTPA